MALEMRSYRPLNIGRRGAVAANHPLATQAGLLALRAGGNAVDAAVATAVTLSVVEPMMSGLGGDGFYHVYEQATGRAVVFNGTGPAPAAASPERYAGGIPRIGPLSVSVPGTLAGLDAMHKSFGRLPWRDLFAEAIAFAAALARRAAIVILPKSIAPRSLPIRAALRFSSTRAPRRRSAPRSSNLRLPARSKRSLPMGRTPSTAAA